MKLPMGERTQAGDKARRRTLQAGGYTALVIAGALALLVLVNVIVAQLPTALTKPDVTAGRLYALEEQTQTLVSELQQEVTVYHLATQGSEDTVLSKVLDRYADLSPQLRVERKDPAVYPTFAQQYTTQQISNNSLIVVCGDRSRYIDYSEIYLTTITDYSSFSYTTQFGGEQALTSAIAYVTGGELPQIYALTGHGETALGEDLKSAIDSQNMLLDDLSLLTHDKVPEDADVVIVHAPQSDLSQEDCDKLGTYVDAGGRLLVFTGAESDTPALDGLMARYGMTAQRGVVLEGDSTRYIQAPYLLLPDLKEHEITRPLSSGGYYVLAPLAHGISMAEQAPEGVSLSPLLTTSQQGYLKGYDSPTLEREEGDPTGIFTLAAAASIETETDVPGQVVWIATTQLEQYDRVVAGGNSDLILNALGWMSGQEETIAIHPKSLDGGTLTIPAAMVTQLSIVVMAIVPLAFLAAGLWVWQGRRTR